MESLSYRASKEIRALRYNLHLLEKGVKSMKHRVREKKPHEAGDGGLKSRVGKEQVYSVQAVLQALHTANESVVLTKSNQSRSPMEMLSRGYLGEEVACLINTLNLNSEILKSVVEENSK